MTDDIRPLMVKFLPRLRKFAYALSGNADQGDDLVQETCMRALARADQWQPFIKALAIGGHATGLRVMWKTAPDDRRFLWNRLPDSPSLVGPAKPQPGGRNHS